MVDSEQVPFSCSRTATVAGYLAQTLLSTCRRYLPNQLVKK